MSLYRKKRTLFEGGWILQLIDSILTPRKKLAWTTSALENPLRLNIHLLTIPTKFKLNAERVVRHIPACPPENVNIVVLTVSGMVKVAFFRRWSVIDFP